LVTPGYATFVTHRDTAAPVRKLLPLVLLVAACGSTTSSTTPPLTPAPTAGTTGSVPTQALTPSTTGTVANQPVANCGSAAQGGADQISSTGVPCPTAQEVAIAYVKTIQGGSPAPSILSAGGTQFTCSSVSQSQGSNVSCDAPGNPGAVTFKTR
jgi:hypothetical protein